MTDDQTAPEEGLPALGEPEGAFGEPDAADPDTASGETADFADDGDEPDFASEHDKLTVDDE